MEYLVDMQDLKLSNSYFIVKEIAFISLNNDDDSDVLIFKKACRWKDNHGLSKKQYEHSEGYNHGLGWISGDISYNLIEDTLRPVFKNAIKIVVMGWSKKLWLEEHFKFDFEIQDIAKNGLPPLDKIDLETVCPHHNGVPEIRCALHNVRLMKKYLKERSSSA